MLFGSSLIKKGINRERDFSPLKEGKHLFPKGITFADRCYLLAGILFAC